MNLIFACDPHERIELRGLRTLVSGRQRTPVPEEGRIEQVLRNDPAPGVMRHADAGYEEAIDCARKHGLRLPGIMPDA